MGAASHEQATMEVEDIANAKASVQVAKAVEQAMMSQFEQSQQELLHWWEKRKEAAERITASLFDERLECPDGTLAPTATPVTQSRSASAQKLRGSASAVELPVRSASAQRLLAAGFTLESSSGPSSLRAPADRQSPIRSVVGRARATDVRTVSACSVPLRSCS